MADNYFANGVEWSIKMAGPDIDNHNIPSTYDIKVKVDGDTIVDGVKALKVYATDRKGDSHLEAIIRVDGDKVYTLNNYETNEWYLAYDFSLEEGDICHVSRFDAITENIAALALAASYARAMLQARNMADSRHCNMTFTMEANFLAKVMPAVENGSLELATPRESLSTISQMKWMV